MRLSKCKKRAMVVVATAGRLVDLLENEKKRVAGWLATVAVVVLDEADRLAVHPDMAEQVDAVLAAVGERRRTCLVSATRPRGVRSKWDSWAPRPRARVEVDAVSVGDAGADGRDSKNGGGNDANLSKIPAHVRQTVDFCEPSSKPEKLVATLTAIRRGEDKRKKSLGIVFFGSRKTLQCVHQLLVRSEIGTGCGAFHGKLVQSQREETLENFRRGKVTTLLATDIASRGIDVSNVEWVINFDFPDSLDQVRAVEGSVVWLSFTNINRVFKTFQYVHRCGRAGRSKAAASKNSSRKAVAHSFFTSDAGVSLAKDLVALLKSGGSTITIDPKLLQFASAGDDTSASENKHNKK